MESDDLSRNCKLAKAFYTRFGTIIYRTIVRMIWNRVNLHEMLNDWTNKFIMIYENKQKNQILEITKNHYTTLFAAMNNKITNEQTPFYLQQNEQN